MFVLPGLLFLLFSIIYFICRYNLALSLFVCPLLFLVLSCILGLGFKLFNYVTPNTTT